MERVTIPLRYGPTIWLLRLLHSWWTQIVLVQFLHHRRRHAIHSCELVGHLAILVVWLADNRREKAEDSCFVAGSMAMWVLLFDRFALSPESVEPEDQDG
jgi:hypothetical protein